jgi:hypothetical protein
MMSATTGTKGRWTKTGEAVTVVDFTERDRERLILDDLLRVGSDRSSWLIPAVEFEARS